MATSAWFQKHQMKFELSDMSCCRQVSIDWIKIPTEVVKEMTVLLIHLKYFADVYNSGRSSIQPNSLVCVKIILK